MTAKGRCTLVVSIALTVHVLRRTQRSDFNFRAFCDGHHISYDFSMYRVGEADRKQNLGTSSRDQDNRSRDESRLGRRKEDDKALVKGTNNNEWIDASDGVTNDADVVYGFGGNDTIYGLGGNDHLYGGYGDDLLKGGGGADLLSGGDGFDTASYIDSPNSVQIYLHLGLASGGDATGDTLISIENLTGSNYSDKLGGDDVSNVLNGQEGNDILMGRGGNDTLYGGSGEDIISGDAGADTLNGGPGFDLAEYLNSPEGVNVALLSGQGFGGDAAGDQLIGIEGLSGSNYGDSLKGDDTANCFWGEDGGDTIQGHGGDDSIFGGGGNDWLHGQDGFDVLSGWQGADHLYGGLNGVFGDSLSGGDGADSFVWTSVAEAAYDLANLGCTADNIGDFNQREDDVIDLSGIDANENASGNQGFTFIGTAGFSGNPGEINYFYDGGDTYIQLQTDTSPEAEGIIRLVGIHIPEADWFIL
jgi:serralysin